MKAKLFDRVLLAVLLIFALALSLALIIVAFRVFPESELNAAVGLIYNVDVNAIILGAIGLLLLLVALRLMFSGVKKKEPTPTSALIKSSELGAAFITLNAIDAMVQKHCRANNRIRSVISNVRALRDGGIVIRVQLALMPDTDIPELTQALQVSMKEYVERLSGIRVMEVGILVEDTSINPKSRVD